jgi:mannose-6-phosphate isomerase-like protein (cupin superfamily)
MPAAATGGEPLKPALIHNDDVDWQNYPGEAGTIRLKRLVSRKDQGSELGMGLTQLKPGQATVWWSFMPEDDTAPHEMWFGDKCHETYYILSGRVLMIWRDGEGNGDEVEAGPGDSLYMAPNYYYQVRCVGDEPALFLFAFMPSAR